MTKEELSNNFEKESVRNIFELGSDVEKFGGNQKFVLVKSEGTYFVGSLPFADHSEILRSMIDEENKKIEILGGGVFMFFNNEIILDGTSYSLGLGPVRLEGSELVEVMQKCVGDRYKVVIGD